jgi:hypothetical protein
VRAALGSHAQSEHADAEFFCYGQPLRAFCGLEFGAIGDPRKRLPEALTFATRYRRGLARNQCDLREPGE